MAILCSAALLLAVGSTRAQRAAAQQPWQAWRIVAQASRLEEYLGRDALVLQGGTAWLDGIDLRDGTVEFDVAMPDTMSFHGLAFRARDDANYEHVYLRPHLSGLPDATQYTPVYGGVSGWQIYASPRFAQPAVLATERWVHVKAVFQGARLELSVDGQTRVFPELIRPVAGGRIGLTSTNAPGRFANVVVRPGPGPGQQGGAGPDRPATPEGVIRCWRVSTPFAETRLAGRHSLDRREWGAVEWGTLEAGVGGIANLAMLWPRTAGVNTVFAAVTLRARRAGPAQVRFGFSDRVHVYLNGRLLYRGNDRFQSRDYRFLGTIGLFDELSLPLRQGDNELWLAVSEDFGGWGVILQVAPTPGVEVVSPSAAAGACAAGGR